MPPRATLRRRVQLVLDLGHLAGYAGAAYEAGMNVLIVANVAAAVVETVPAIRDAAPLFFDAFEVFSVGVFTLEYALRLWSAPDDPRYARSSPSGARLRMLRDPLMIVDFLAFAPAYLALLFSVADLRILRIFRLLRLLKLARYSPALTTFAHVVSTERRALAGTLLLVLCVMFFSAYAMYLAESQVQPRIFGTVPDAMWWAISTITTVGYGDAVPMTVLGKLIGAVTMILGLGLFALPVGILATGFMNEIRRRDFVVTWGMLSRMKLFEGFDAEIIGDVMGALRTLIAETGSRIHARGAYPEAVYFIVSGEVEIDHPANGRKFLGPGDFFGETELLHARPHEAAAGAHSYSQLLFIPAEDFRGLLRKHAPLRERIERYAAGHAGQGR